VGIIAGIIAGIINFTRIMENKPGPKKQEEYRCRCCNTMFNTSKQRSTHESNKRTQGTGPEKRFKPSKSAPLSDTIFEEKEETTPQHELFSQSTLIHTMSV
jgi:hypothetical protein